MITRFSLKIELDGLTEARDCHRFIDQIIVYGGERPHFIAYRGEKDKKLPVVSVSTAGIVVTTPCVYASVLPICCIYLFCMHRQDDIFPIDNKLWTTKLVLESYISRP